VSESLYFKLADIFDLLNDTGLDIAAFAIFRKFVARVASDKDFAGGVFWTGAFERLDSAGNHVENGEEEPEGEEDFEFDLGLL
jgi:hypothetical protein